MLNNPNAMRGGVPAMGNPQMGKSPKLPPQAMAVLRKDPEIIQAVTKFMGRPVPMDKIPDQLLIEIAGMVHKLGVDGAVQKFMQSVPPQLQAQIKASSGA